MRHQCPTVLILGFTALLIGSSSASAQLSTFSVLGGSTVTNTGATTVNGDLGVSPGSAVTGFPPGIVTGGTIHAADAVAAQAQTDLTTLYNSLAGMACNTDLSGQDLGGMTLTPGVYCFSTSAQLTGTLTLDAQGNSGALFIFKIGSTLTTASASSVLLINGASSCNVFWQVGSSATLGTGTALRGSIVALTSITLNTAASVQGKALARNGAVTLDTNNVALCVPSLQAVPTLSQGGLIILTGLLTGLGLMTLRRRTAAALPRR
jgi:type VI secretion system secreted protein VgrG